MSKKLSKVLGVLLVCVMFFSIFMVGCSNEDESADFSTDKVENQSVENKKEEKSESDQLVQLKWYCRMPEQKDFPIVMDEVNKYLKEKINVELDFVRVDSGSYNDKMRMVISSGEEFDICFTSHWANDFFGNVAKGAFLPLNDLIDEYAPKTYAQVPENFWDAVTVNGEKYGVINYQIVGRESGYRYQKEYIDKYGFDVSAVKAFADIEPLLADVSMGEPGIAALSSQKQPQYFSDGLIAMGVDEIGARYSPGAVLIGSEDPYKVVNQYELPMYNERVDLIREWYLKGYLPKDGATIDSDADLTKAGKIAGGYADIKPGGKAEAEKLYGDRELVEMKIADAFVTTNSIAATLQAISRTSNNPEKAMMLLELVNTDKDLYNLMVFGIEGQHYNKIGENRIELVENSGFNHNKGWAIGYQFNAYLYGEQADTVWEDTMSLNNNANSSALLGFVFDQEPVKAEVAQCSAVLEEYGAGLRTGSIDPDEYLPIFIDKLNKAGAEKIIAEKQRQIDEWLKTK